MAKIDSMIRVSVDYEHDGLVVAKEQGRVFGSVLEQESLQKALYRLWYLLEYSAAYVFEVISATEIRLKCRSHQYAWVSVMVGEGDDRHELQIREKTVVFTGTPAELRSLHEFLFWCHRFGGERYDGRLDAIIDVVGESEPQGPALLPLICLSECYRTDRSKVDLFILQQYGVDKEVRKLLRGFIRQSGIVRDITAAGEMWLEDTSGASLGQFLSYVFGAKSAARAA